MEFAKSKIKKKLLEQEARKSETSTSEPVRAGATPVRRRGRLGLRADASEPGLAEGAEGGNPDEEEEAGEVGWSAPVSPQPLRSSDNVHIVVNAAKVRKRFVDGTKGMRDLLLL